MTFASDAKRTYPQIIRGVMLRAQLMPILSRARTLSLAGRAK
jgi:hypothetical protein